MTPTELQSIIRDLGISRGRFGLLLGATRRSGENWTDPRQSEVPGPVATLARLLRDRPELVHLLDEGRA